MGLMETNNNIKDLNIAEILRYAPKGLKLYSPLLGDVRLEKVSDHDDTIVVTTKYKSERVFFEDGKYDSNGECLLFPSINHRCWNNWQNTLFLESIGSMCVDTITGNKFILGEDGTYFSDNTGNSYHFLIDDEDSGNYLLNSRYASPEEAISFIEELEKNGYEWDGKKVVKNKEYYSTIFKNQNSSTSSEKEPIKPKFKVGDIVKFDRPSAMLKREILSIDFDNERYLTRRTDIGGAIKEFIYFCEQDDYVIVGSHDNNPSLEVKVSVLIDEISSIKQDIESLKVSRNQARMRIDSLEDWVIENGNPIKPKFKVGDVIKHKPTGEINTIKKVCINYYVFDDNSTLYFVAQDMWELVASKVEVVQQDKVPTSLEVYHAVNNIKSLENKVSMLADEIIALKERNKALEIQVIKDMNTPPMTKDPYFKSNKITCDVFKTPDKAGDNVTLEEMRNECKG